MRAARATIWSLVLASAVLLAAPPVVRSEEAVVPAAAAVGPEGADQIPAEFASGDGAIEVPDLPEAVVSIPPAEASTAAAPPIDLGIPAPPAAEVTLTAADILRSALMERLEGFVAAPGGRLPRKEREAVAAFYSDTEFRALWIREGRWNAAALSAIGRLAAAAEDGLDPAQYPVPAIDRQKASPADLADAELGLSASIVAYARDARGARIEPSRLSQLITPKLDIPAAGAVLRAVSSAKDAGDALAAFQPQHEGYGALKQHLAELRERRPSRPMVQVPQGRALSVGMVDPRVPLIRARFNLGPAPGNQNAYDDRVASAVAAFQKERGLPASGVLTRQTIAALGGGASTARLEGDLVANMERWRWLPSDLGSRHIAVNVPEFRLRLVEGGEVVRQTRSSSEGPRRRRRSSPTRWRP
jgi:murein L,D-transpeptidase YcbB/YkuD